MNKRAYDKIIQAKLFGEMDHSKWSLIKLIIIKKNKLGYNKLGYNENSVITNKYFSLVALGQWFPTVPRHTSLPQWGVRGAAKFWIAAFLLMFYFKVPPNCHFLPRTRKGRKHWFYTILMILFPGYNEQN